MSDSPEISTHALFCTFTSDGVPREFQIMKSDKDRVAIVLKTWWNGFDDAPAVTNLVIGEHAFAALLHAMAEFDENMESYRQPTKSS